MSTLELESDYRCYGTRDVTAARVTIHPRAAPPQAALFAEFSRFEVAIGIRNLFFFSRRWWCLEWPQDSCKRVAHNARGENKNPALIKPPLSSFGEHRHPLGSFQAPRTSTQRRRQRVLSRLRLPDFKVFLFFVYHLQNFSLFFGHDDEDTRPR